MSAARRCWRHVLPTFVTVVVIGINIAIGGQAVASVAAAAGSASAGHGIRRRCAAARRVNGANGAGCAAGSAR